MFATPGNATLTQHSASVTNVSFASPTNGPGGFTSWTTIGEVGGTTAGAVLTIAAATPGTTVYPAGTTSIVLANTTNLSVGAAITDTTTSAAIPLGTVIRSISGNTVTLSAPLAAAFGTLTDSLSIANENVGGQNTDTITFANAALNGSIAIQATAV